MGKEEQALYHKFHLGARGGPPEDHPEGLYQEDMYGNLVLSPEKKESAEAEAEES